ncbi:MAG: Ig domain-containing protein [Comamonadaceae bacterium]|nr:Ig domain-containing protein [Comamonadaceae bacterium]
MRFSKFLSIASHCSVYAGVALVAAACGGGGGSPGQTHERYSISLKTNKATLPINIAHERAGAGAYAPYTAALYVSAMAGDRPIPGGKEVFGCHVSPDVYSGALYYLDGDPEHEIEEEIPPGSGNKVKFPAPYKSIVLGANSGGAVFHFHAGDKAGTPRVTCSVTDPKDGQVYSASVDITVGGSTKLPASISFDAQAPGYLGSALNVDNRLRNNVSINAFVMDDANQPVPDPVAPNLQVSIVPQPGTAYAGARLLSGSVSGSALQVATSGGVGLFSLSSGPEEGVILLSLLADRYDNNVNNGVTDPVQSLISVQVVHKNPEGANRDPIEVEEKELNATNGVPFSYALQAKGGNPPYKWSAAGALPNGLAINSSGVISGTPQATPGTYSVAVAVTDSRGASVTGTIQIVIEEGVQSPNALSIVGCNAADANVPCALPGATKGQTADYVYVLSAAGGDMTAVPTWTLVNGPANVSVDRTTGELRIKAAALAACATLEMEIKLVRGSSEITRKVQVPVQAPNGGTC